MPDSPNQPPSRMGHPSSFVTSPSAPPIFQTTAFDIPDVGVLEQIYSGQLDGHIYTRDSNPNHTALADSLASMERAETGAVFSSGMGAIASIVMSMASAGDHVLVSRSVYGRTLQLFRRLQTQFNVQVTEVGVTDLAHVAKEIRPETRLCLTETISNPLLEVADIAELSQTLGSVPLIVDNTFTTPELLRPLEHGAHAVVHSASKYLNGHGDVMLGAAAGSQQLMSNAMETASLFGQNANPFESWLTQRGLRTLPLRMQHICETTRNLAAFLQDQPNIRRVHFPLLSQHSSYDVASKLYPRGTGGIITVELAAEGTAAVTQFMQAVPELPFSPTLADARTTLSHPASTSHRYMTEAERKSAGILPEMIRISVGLESLEQLQNEFAKGLAAI
jgi:cystathionine beta-lyase/cystathionine gamma-synthase